MRKRLGQIIEKATMKIISHMNFEGAKNGEYTKTNGIRTLMYYQNDRTITCVITSGSIKAVGTSKCHPNDEFIEFKGIAIAEHRARSEYYRQLASRV